MTIVDVAPDILVGPYSQELRDELRRQLEKLGVELVLGSPVRALPDTPPAVAGPVSVTTEAGETVTADIWYQCFGVTPQTGYLRGALAQARDEQGYLRVDEQLRVVGQDRVYAVGDIANADRDMAGIAGRQGDLVAANLTARITGTGEEQPYQPMPPVILVPLGPEGGAGLLPDAGVIGAEKASQIKGRTLLIEHLSALFAVDRD